MVSVFGDLSDLHQLILPEQLEEASSESFRKWASSEAHSIEASTVTLRLFLQQPMPNPAPEDSKRAKVPRNGVTELRAGDSKSPWGSVGSVSVIHLGLSFLYLCSHSLLSSLLDAHLPGYMVFLQNTGQILPSPNRLPSATFFTVCCLPLLDPVDHRHGFLQQAAFSLNDFLHSKRSPTFPPIVYGKH